MLRKSQTDWVCPGYVHTFLSCCAKEQDLIPSPGSTACLAVCDFCRGTSAWYGEWAVRELHVAGTSLQQLSYHIWSHTSLWHTCSLSYRQLVITPGHPTLGATANISWWPLCNASYETMPSTHRCCCCDNAHSSCLCPEIKKKQHLRSNPLSWITMYRKAAQQKMAQNTSSKSCLWHQFWGRESLSQPLPHCNNAM